MKEAPLPTLLSRALLQFARDYREVGRTISHPSTPTLIFWSNVLRYLDPDGMLLVDAPRAARLSRRMVKPLLDGFARAGGIVIEPGAGRGKQVVKLTPAGLAMQQAWAPLMDVVTDSWSVRFGATDVERLGEVLKGVVRRFELEHPHFPQGYGAVDDSVTGGAAVPGDVGPPFIPPHGTDWVPVVRNDESSVASLPVPALLSQALTEFAMRLELHGEASLSEAWMMRAIPATGAPVGHVAAMWGDNFKLKAAIERRGILQLANGVVSLSPKGRALTNSYGRAISNVEASWQRSFGRDVVGDLRDCLETMRLGLDHDLPDHPMVTWVGGIRVVGADD